MGVAEVKGIQSQHVMAQIKHYVGYDSDDENTFIDDQTLHEVYVAPFDAAVKAGVASIMCSYNRLNGTFACGNKDTLTTSFAIDSASRASSLLIGEPCMRSTLSTPVSTWRCPASLTRTGWFSIPSFFDSLPSLRPLHADARATSQICSAATFPRSLPPPVEWVRDFGVKLDPKKMPDAMKDGTVTEATITRAAGRVLYEMVHFGYLDGQSKHDVTKQAIEDNAKIIEKTGEDAAVLAQERRQRSPPEA